MQISKYTNSNDIPNVLMQEPPTAVQMCMPDTYLSLSKKQSRNNWLHVELGTLMCREAEDLVSVYSTGFLVSNHKAPLG